MSTSSAGTKDGIAGHEGSAISAAEAKFERVRRTVGLFLGPLVAIAVSLAPLTGISVEAHRLAAVVSLVVVWWITEAIPIPVTALIGSALMVLTGVTSAQQAFAPFANPVIFLFIGSFMIGQAVTAHGLDQRVAGQLLGLRAIRGNLARTRIVLLGFVMLVSAWMSNTATTAMVIPIALGVLSSVGLSVATAGRQYTSGFLLVLAYGASIGGLMTPVGTPPNLIAIGLLDRLADVKIGFLTWMAIGVPIAVCLGIALYLVSAWFLSRSGAAPPDAVAPAPLVAAEPAPLTRGQTLCLVAFATAAILWILPGVFALVGDKASPIGSLISRLDEGVVAIVAASLLFVLPVNWQRREFALRWEQASQIDWGTILLFGGGLAMGEQMFRTGLAERLGLVFVGATGADSLWTVTALALGLSILLTEITSNTAATNMLVPVVISMCQVASLNPVPPALAVALGASMAFMLPISTPPNAIVYGTGLVRLMDMVRMGVILDAIAFVIVLVGLRMLCPLLGLV